MRRRILESTFNPIFLIFNRAYIKLSVNISKLILTGEH
jgi:hypothetical protein